MEQRQSADWASPAWRQHAACRGMPSEMFISSAPMMTAAEIATAKDVCGRCSVVDDCLVYAITNSVTVGIWGGLTANELKPLHSAWRSQLAATVA